MYKCFENIPLKKRQDAFERLIAFTVASWRSSTIAPQYHVRRADFISAYPDSDGRAEKRIVTYCPLGLVNVELGLNKRECIPLHLLADVHPDDWLRSVCLPRNGAKEQEYLSLVGIPASKISLAQFIKNNDEGKFRSWAVLAKAMGVTDTSQEVWANEIKNK